MTSRKDEPQLREPLNTLDMMTLIALASMDATRRKQYSADQFFGISAWVEDLLKQPIPTLQRALLEAERIEWDGKVPLWTTIVEERIRVAELDKAEAIVSLDDSRLRYAKKILACRGSVSLAVFEAARAVVLEASKKMESPTEEKDSNGGI